MCGRTSWSDDCLECLVMLVGLESNASAGHRRPRMNSPYTSCNFSPGHAAPVAYRSLIRKCQAVKDKRDPSGSVATCISDETLGIRLMTWGLVPSYTKSTTSADPNHFLMFNARSETVSSKPLFSRLTKNQRCVTAVDGFYEWHTFDGGPGVRKDGQPLLLACLYDMWRREQHCENEGSFRSRKSVNQQDEEDVHILLKREDENGCVLSTYTILTMSTEGTGLHGLHNRMPIMLDEEMAKAWLTGGDDGIAAVDALKAASFDVDKRLHWHPVTVKMGSTKYQEDDCTHDISADLKKATGSPITKYFSPKQRTYRRSDDISDVKFAATRLTFNDNNAKCAEAVDSPGIKAKAGEEVKAEIELKSSIKIHQRQKSGDRSGQSQKRRYKASLEKSHLHSNGGMKQARLDAFVSPSKQA